MPAGEQKRLLRLMGKPYGPFGRSVAWLIPVGLDDGRQASCSQEGVSPMAAAAAAGDGTCRHHQHPPLWRRFRGIW